MADYQYVFTMQGVGKVVPPKREILKDIYLSFLPGAKIGVLGLNGAGKSTILNISQKAQPNWHGYGIAKSALRHSAELWQMEHPKKAIRFNALNPGRMRTTAFMRAYPGLDPASIPSPTEACEPFLYLLSDAARNIRGQLLDAKTMRTE